MRHLKEHIEPSSLLDFQTGRLRIWLPLVCLIGLAPIVASFYPRPRQPEPLSSSTLSIEPEETVSSSISAIPPSITAAASLPPAADCRKVHRRLEDALKEPDQVCTLLLEDQRLTLLPSAIGKFHNLITLSLKYNQLEQLP